MSAITRFARRFKEAREALQKWGEEIEKILGTEFSSQGQAL